MVNQTDDLWRGGPWEQPSPGFSPPPPVILPEGALAPRRPVLRPRRRRRWPAVVGFLALLLGLALLSVGLHQWYQSRDARDWQSGPDSGDRGAHTQEFSTEPPLIPRAETGTGVTVALLPTGDAPLTYTQIYDKNLPSIVSIEAAYPTEYSSGTGVVLTADGYVITNAHVVAGAESVRVIFCDNTILSASLVGFDADEDLAVLKVDAQDLIPAQFGDSGELRCGDPVAAIGDPLGYRSTITDGIVSALDREVEVEGSTMVLIQTSAAINFGNSGGALINQYGQVVGITTIKIITKDGSAEALGFAIPSSRVKYVVDTLIAGGDICAGVFGFTVSETPAPGGGLVLRDVNPKSDAHAQGLLPGDVILAAEGLPVNGIQDLIRLKLTRGAGDPVTLTYSRQGQTFTVRVCLVDPDTLKED